MIVMFMCVELMLNAVNLTFVSFANELNDIRGQVIVFFTLVVAAAEVAVGLGIIVAIFRRRRGATADDLDLLKDPTARGRERRATSSISIWIVPALPLFGAVVPAALRQAHRRADRGLDRQRPDGVWRSCASIVMFFAMLAPAARAHAVNVVTLFTWLPAGQPPREHGLLRRPAVGHVDPARHRRRSLIHLYSIGYMHGDERFSRFFAYLNLFAASMLILVLGSSFLVTFLGWEGVGLCSYLLVSFWFERNAAAVAGKKAFVTNRVGDVGFLLAMFLIFESYGSLDYAAIGAGATRISTRHRDRDRAAPARRRRSARARRSRCTSGCPTRWKARPRCRRSSTPRPW